MGVPRLAREAWGNGAWGVREPGAEGSMGRKEGLVAREAGADTGCEWGVGEPEYGIA